ncbi:MULTISPECIES: GreA/GreB family elongation factor [Bizionia]|uniref:Transcription elongation factor GreA n=1 Tax=Bizionia algoritergicola TaxID=291187 RepID=A0A5D0QMC0_9FLAO|nr:MULTISPECIES: GreA/GreB family elongation factor [Bizionia]OBX21031.1 transcription elongation factor GreA [Bizionia sp. APA-3]TYB70065.1 transcription elongation factor GreA [Bizionia algoritergicola]
MSRGFVKEEDQEEIPIVAPRANLPFGVVNYVTNNGLEELKQEQNLLLEQQKTLIEESNETNRVQINYITTKLSLLEDRISSARIVDLSTQPQNEIHFGATITLFKQEENCKCQYQIVGVDEANISLNKISFLSPLAKVLRNKKVGDVIALQTPMGKRNMNIELIEY